MRDTSLYVELLADGTVPQRVELSRYRPTILPEGETYTRADVEDGDRTYYAFVVDPPLDEEGAPWWVMNRSVPLYVVVTWVDDDGYNVEVETNPLVAAANACSGWGDMPHRVEYQHDPELDAGPNLCAHGGYGLEYDGDGNVERDSGDQGETTFVHVYERPIR